MCTIFVPDFRHATVESAIQDGTTEGFHTARNILQNQSWITRDLQDYMEQFFPQDGDIAQGTAIRNPEAFESACTVLFKHGNIYASAKQLTQVVTLFLDKWGAKAVCHGKKICCFYHEPRKRQPVVGTIKKYHVQTSQKVLVKCPFVISYSLIDFVRHKKHPMIFHQVKVTSTNFRHTCQLCPTFLRQAKIRSGTCLKVDVPNLTTVMELLRHNPNTGSNYIRPFLTKALPTWHSFDCYFISNFRKRAVQYWARNDNNPDHHISMQEAEQLTSSSTADKTLDWDDPVISNNYIQLLRRVMQETSAPWKVRKYLEQAALNTPGFSYRILTNEEGKPTCITWTTPRMRRDIIRFGDVLFLDAQMRQYNTAGFPYASIVMINDENQICTGCETLYIEESTAGYTQMIRDMAEMESRWLLSDVRFVFGDLKITPRLLTDTGMMNAQLRCDTWHLLNEVWPKNESFGNLFHSLSPFLRTMVESKTRKDWDMGHNSAQICLQTEPGKSCKLEAVYNNPGYYAGYRLHELEGSLGKQGDSHAEQNHASIVAHLGRGGTFDLAEQVHKLMERHQVKVRQRMNLNSDLIIRIHKYASPYRTPNDKSNDELAHAALSSFAHKTYFKHGFEHSRRLQNRHDDDGQYVVWPGNIPEIEVNLDQVHCLSESSRCQCP